MSADKSPEVKRLEAQLAALYRDLCAAEDRGAGCEHVTLRSGRLPCAHPDCTSADYIHVLKDSPRTVAYYGMEQVMPETDEVQRWRRERVNVRGVFLGKGVPYTYGWRLA